VAAGGRYPSLEGQHPQPISQMLGTFKLDAQVTANIRHSSGGPRIGRTGRTRGRRQHPSHRDPRSRFPTRLDRGRVHVGPGQRRERLRVEWAFTRAVKSPVFEQGLGYRFPSINYGNIPGWEFELPNPVTGQQLTSAYGVITQYETTGRSTRRCR
jgi:hypothetical protein